MRAQAPRVHSALLVGAPPRAASCMHAGAHPSAHLFAGPCGSNQEVMSLFFCCFLILRLIISLVLKSKRPGRAHLFAGPCGRACPPPPPRCFRSGRARRRPSPASMWAWATGTGVGCAACCSAHSHGSQRPSPPAEPLLRLRGGAPHLAGPTRQWAEVVAPLSGARHSPLLPPWSAPSALAAQHPRIHSSTWATCPPTTPGPLNATRSHRILHLLSLRGT